MLGNEIEHFRGRHQVASLWIALRVLDHILSGFCRRLIRRKPTSPRVAAAKSARYIANISLAALGNDYGATHGPPPIGGQSTIWPIFPLAVSRLGRPGEVAVPAHGSHLPRRSVLCSPTARVDRLQRRIFLPPPCDSLGRDAPLSQRVGALGPNDVRKLDSDLRCGHMSVGDIA